MHHEPETYVPLTAAARQAAGLLEIPDEKAAHRVLSACLRYIADLEERDSFGLRAADKTRLARVDSFLRPYELSANLKRSLSASLDHLHALSRLFTKGHTQHTYTPFSILRGSLEASAQGLYGLGSRNTRTMIERSLHLEYSNVKNSHAFRRAFAEINPEDRRLSNLEARAEAANIPAKSLKEHLPYSVIIGTVDAEHGADGTITAIWKLTSGIAHNKSWALVALTDRQEIEGTRDELGAEFYVTSNTRWLATCMLTACILHEMLVITHYRCCLGIGYRREALQGEALLTVMASQGA